jgi:hypothetical protein
VPQGVLLSSQVNGSFVNQLGGPGGGFAPLALPAGGPPGAGAAAIPVNAPWALLLLAAVVLAATSFMIRRRKAGSLLGIAFVTVGALAASLDVHAQSSGIQLIAENFNTLAAGGVQAVSIRSDGKTLYLDIQLAKSDPCLSEPDLICGGAVDGLPAISGMVVSRFSGGSPEGLPYKSTSGDGAVFTGKTSSNGEFYTFVNGRTEFTIGNVNLGNWYEPQASKKGSVAQLKVDL